MEKFSLIDIKKMNYSDVYHYIYEHPRCARQTIAADLSMSLPTVTQHLNTLLEEGLIEKCGQLSSNIGRKAAAYTIVPTARIAVGVEIIKKQIVIAALDLTGQALSVKTVPLHFEKTDFYYKTVCDSIHEFIKEFDFTDSQILGIGFGWQGLVSSDGQEVIYGKILDCTGINSDLFEKNLNLPCRFYHDSECAAMVDMWRNPSIENAVYLSLGHHLGGALIIDGQMHSGRTGRSGTFEHMTLVPDGRPCYCGKHGCMECYCSADALLHENEDLTSFFQEKQNSNPEHLTRWDDYLDYLSMAVNNIHMAIDLDVYLGGHLSPYMTEDDILTLHQKVNTRTAFPEQESFIYLGTREKHAIAIGAALPLIREYLDHFTE